MKFGIAYLLLIGSIGTSSSLSSIKPSSARMGASRGQGYYIEVLPRPFSGNGSLFSRKQVRIIPVSRQGGGPPFTSTSINGTNASFVSFGHFDETSLRAEYNAWRIKYNKKADDLRFQIFKRNLLTLEEHSKFTGKPIILNEYADMSREEFAMQRNGSYRASNGSSTPTNIRVKMSTNENPNGATRTLENTVSFSSEPTSTVFVNNFVQNKNGYAAKNGQSTEDRNGSSAYSDGRIRALYETWAKKYEKSTDEIHFQNFKATLLQLEKESEITGKVMHLDEYADSPPADSYTEARVRAAYETWATKHDRDQDEFRFKNFLRNYLRLEKVSQETGQPIQLNEYSDYTDEEFARQKTRPADVNDVGSDPKRAGFVSRPTQVNGVKPHSPDPMNAFTVPEEASPYGVRDSMFPPDQLRKKNGYAAEKSRPVENDVAAFDDSRVRSFYDTWTKHFNKTPDEVRYRNFKRNFLMLEQYGKETGKTINLNEFVDAAEDEFRRHMPADFSYTRPAPPRPAGSTTKEKRSVHLNEFSGLSDDDFDGLPMRDYGIRPPSSTKQQQPPKRNSIQLNEFSGFSDDDLNGIVGGGMSGTQPNRSTETKSRSTKESATISVNEVTGTLDKSKDENDVSTQEPLSRNATAAVDEEAMPETEVQDVSSQVESEVPVSHVPSKSANKDTLSSAQATDEESTIKEVEKPDFASAVVEEKVPEPKKLGSVRINKFPGFQDIVNEVGPGGIIKSFFAQAGEEVAELIADKADNIIANTTDTPVELEIAESSIIEADVIDDVAELSANDTMLVNQKAMQDDLLETESASANANATISHCNTTNLAEVDDDVDQFNTSAILDTRGEFSVPNETMKELEIDFKSAAVEEHDAFGNRTVVNNATASMADASVEGPISPANAEESAIPSIVSTRTRVLENNTDISLEKSDEAIVDQPSPANINVTSQDDTASDESAVSKPLNTTKAQSSVTSDEASNSSIQQEPTKQLSVENHIQFESKRRGRRARGNARAARSEAEAPRKSRTNITGGFGINESNRKTKRGWSALDSSQAPYSDAHIQAVYEAWAVKHGKDPSAARFQNFKTNFVERARLEKETGNFVEFSEYADLTKDEFLRLHSPFWAAKVTDISVRDAYDDWCKKFDKEASEERFLVFEMNFQLREERRKTTGYSIDLDETADLRPDEVSDSTKAAVLEAESAPLPDLLTNVSATTLDTNATEAATGESLTPESSEDEIPLTNKEWMSAYEDWCKKNKKQPSLDLLKNFKDFYRKRMRRRGQKTESDAREPPIAATAEPVTPQRQADPSPTATSDDDPVIVAYKQWCAKYGKEHSEGRFKVFQINYQKQLEWFAQTGELVELNEYAGMTREEFVTSAPTTSRPPWFKKTSPMESVAERAASVSQDEAATESAKGFSQMGWFSSLRTMPALTSRSSASTFGASESSRAIDPALAAYEKWCKKHGKVPDKKRFIIFRGNFEQQALWMKKTGKYVQLNAFADMTQEEYLNAGASRKSQKAKMPGSDEQVRDIYIDWCNKLGKEPSENRFQVFRRNYWLQEERRRTSGKPIQLTAYADMMPEEIDEQMSQHVNGKVSEGSPSSSLDAEEDEEKDKKSETKADVRARREYESWCRRYGKKASEGRLKIFKDNLKRIEKKEKEPGEIANLNQYGDWTEEEYKTIVKPKAQFSWTDVIVEAVDVDAESEVEKPAAVDGADGEVTQEPTKKIYVAPKMAAAPKRAKKDPVIDSKVERTYVVESGGIIGEEESDGNKQVMNLIAVGGNIVFGDEEAIMRHKRYESFGGNRVQFHLLYGVQTRLAEKVCNGHNRRFSESVGYYETTTVKDAVSGLEGPTTFYDSVSGKPLFAGPIDRSVEEFFKEAEEHGKLCFRDAEVVWDYVRVLEDSGELVSVDGTHLGENDPDENGNKYVINLSSIAGRPLKH